MYDSIAEGGRAAVSGLWLEERVCSMLTVLLGGDLDVAIRVRVRDRVRCTDNDDER